MELILKNNKQALQKAQQRFIDNYEGFFTTFRLPLQLLVITALLDAFSTFCFMYVLGVEREMHPIVRELSMLLGPFVGPFVGGALKVVLGVSVLIYLRKFERLVIFSCCIVYSYAFIHNIHVSGLFATL